jgi:chromosome segregation ATPase
MTTPQQDQTTRSANGGSSGQDTDQKPDIEQIQADIEQTRQELGETVEALTFKLDVKARARDRLNDTKQRTTEAINDTKQRTTVALRDAQTRATELTRSAKTAATDDQGKPTPTVLGAAAAVVVSAVVAVGLVVWRRRR